MSDIESLLKQIVEDATTFGPLGLEARLVDAMALREATPRPTLHSMERALRGLRSERCFGAMLELAEAFSDRLTLRSRLSQIQALIDQQRLPSAERLLKTIDDDMRSGRLDDELAQRDFPDVERRHVESESAGLMGRIHKQRFVSAHAKKDQDAAANALRAAMLCHQAAYALDPAWHGANLAALAWRANREGLTYPDLPSGIEAGKKLEARLGEPGELTVWGLSALAQACMAQGAWDRGLQHYRAYMRALAVREGPGAAFMLMGDLRQLSEIWLFEDGDEVPHGEILRELSQRILAQPGGRVDLRTNGLRHMRATLQGSDGDREAEAILNDPDTMYPRDLLLRILNLTKAVCQIRPVGNAWKAGGTGFVANAVDVGGDAGSVLVTNAHVITSGRRRYESGTLFVSQAECFFGGLDETAITRITAVLWESPPNEHDIAICSLAHVPKDVTPLSINKFPTPFPQPTNRDAKLGSVVTIGYPHGELKITLGRNRVIDHDLHRAAERPRIVHYEADTEAGSSGGPVLSRDSVDVVAVHRATCTRPIPETPLEFGTAYAANEGVGIHCVATAYRAARKEPPIVDVERATKDKKSTA